MALEIIFCDSCVGGNSANIWAQKTKTGKLWQVHKGQGVKPLMLQLRHSRAWVQIAAAMLPCNSLRQIVHTHHTSVHQAVKLVAAVLGVAGVTAGLAESNGSLPPDLWLMSPAGWLPRTGISSGTLHLVIEYGLPVPFYRGVGITTFAARLGDICSCDTRFKLTSLSLDLLTLRTLHN